ncbi:FliG C-terminal domain protein [Treponema socranskii subsp. socranskii VPI DR56BR1116 = ATCC 35536]|uniref:Flagellar motor switch protein FliG n=2 Tax=Treponema socranskii TaxID=53419 RepID=U1FLN4_TRESO|nr:FliG C-terminal domain protein [Treponema socranskii subsp. socranskii VPI DR56BR1116 = ATCC 35536]ERJ97730.1 FliG C-terminal domain protein [Treponema socranskii subsp. socranskii VPI DR56BR1116 = ATCC 35536]
MLDILFHYIIDAMNLNDIRANAYKNGARKGERPSDESAMKAAGVQAPNEEGSVRLAQSATGSGSNKPFEGVNRKIANIFSESKTLSKQAALQNAGTGNLGGNEGLSRAADTLKRDGLLKIPESSSGDSVYRRVAKFLLIIGVDEAAKVMRHLTEAQTEKIIPEIASIRRVDPKEASEILSEFEGLLKQARQSGGADIAREMLEKAYGAEKAESMLQKAVSLSGGKPFEYLNTADGERVYFLLKDESPAVQALVLSRIKPEKAAAVIGKMDVEVKRDVISRLAKMQPVSPDVLARTDKAIYEKSLSIAAEKAESIDGRSALAEILRRMPLASEDEIIETISGEDADLANDIRKRLFTLGDVEKSDDRFIQELLRSMSEKEVAYLIAGKPEPFRKKILYNVSKGRGDTVLEEEQLAKPMSKRDCDDVTGKFLAAMRSAYEQGTFKIDGRDDGEYVE